MTISITLKEYLKDVGISYGLLKHSPTDDSLQTATIAQIPSKQLAKAVLLEDLTGRYLLAILPANRHIDLGKLNRQFRVHLKLADEDELEEVFDDCVPGAIPPVGEAYGIDVMVDSSLESCKDVYFEGGDHIHLVHLNGKDFRQMMLSARHNRFSRRRDN